MNEPEFQVLCGVIKLSGATMTLQANQDDPTPVYNAIQKPNMSVAPAQWREIFREAGHPGKYLDTVPKALNPWPDWQELWPEWRKAEEAADKADKDDDIKRSGLLDVSPAERSLLQAKISALTAKAQQLMRKLRTDDNQAKPISAAQAGQLINEAVFGESTRPADPTLAKIFGSGITNTDRRETACVMGVETKQAATLAAVMTCLCIEDSRSTVQTACHHGQQTAEQWQSATSLPTNTHITNILNLCGKTKTAKLTAAKVETLIDGITKVITEKSGVGYFGKVVTGCSGTAAAGICASINGYGADHTAALDKIPWIQKLEELRSKLSTTEGKDKKQSKVMEQLKLIEVAIHKSRREVQAIIESTKSTSTDKQNSVFPSNKSPSCGGYTTNTTCTAANNFKWTSTDKSEGDFCKPNDGEGQTNTAGKKGAAGEQKTDSKCKGKKQKDCKHGCKWDNSACKDSSFLVNKKFAMMAAAFMSFVAFYHYNDVYQFYKNYRIYYFKRFLYKL
uniref:Variant surface glycoprotein 1125.4155 n=1 Tax=Trypanosoma brucei TaxID=5691 RepID=A0A1J0RA57_9TRYP|nr:variant surface glycoprotein 1125.4155 [Trypanosoma brucei]